jgi:hypothetical protein
MFIEQFTCFHVSAVPYFFILIQFPKLLVFLYWKYLEQISMKLDVRNSSVPFPSSSLRNLAMFSMVSSVVFDLLLQDSHPLLHRIDLMVNRKHPAVLPTIHVENDCKCFPIKKKNINGAFVSRLSRDWISRRGFYIWRLEAKGQE